MAVLLPHLADVVVEICRKTVAAHHGCLRQPDGIAPGAPPCDDYGVADDDLGMTVRNSRPTLTTPRPLSNWIIAMGALVVLAVAVAIWVVLLRRYGTEEARVQLDVIRTAGTLVIGTGGAVALLLTARRQRSTELTLAHTERDATERRSY